MLTPFAFRSRAVEFGSVKSKRIIREKLEPKNPTLYWWKGSDQMATTPEQRSTHPLCGVKKKNGEKCRNYAGQGTDHLGTGTCKFHGGNMMPSRQKGLTQIANGNINKFAKEMNIHPVEALLWMVRLSAGQVRYLGEELAKTDGEMETAQGIIARRLWNEERDRLASFSKQAIDAGVAERYVRLAEQTGMAIGQVLSAILFAAELALTEQQKAVLPELLKKHLTPLERGHEGEVIDADDRSTLFRGSRPWSAPADGATDMPRGRGSRKDGTYKATRATTMTSQDKKHRPKR